MLYLQKKKVLMRPLSTISSVTMTRRNPQSICNRFELFDTVILIAFVSA
jgi:hypothetical protein